MAGKTLTEQAILSKTKAASLADVHNVSLWGTQLADVSIISKMTNVDTIALSVNEITTLEPFAYCTKLRELYLRKNRIADLRELFHLQCLEHLRVLWLSDNPLTGEDDYRLFTVAALPQLTKLDEVDITAEEREQAKAKFPNPGARFGVKQAPVERVKSQSAVSGVQGHILGAIEILMQDLDAAGLDVLADMVARRKRL